LGSPIFLLRIAEREWWQNVPPTTAQQPDRIVTHTKSLCYFTTTYSTSVYCFLVYSNHQFALLLEHSTQNSGVVPPLMTMEMATNYCLLQWAWPVEIKGMVSCEKLNRNLVRQSWIEPIDTSILG
jgi:hypothetical protein